VECDWEIEIASNAPIIDAAWEGFIDLRCDTGRVKDICETAQFPALAEALVRLNSPSSPVWTAKCDMWPANTVDPDELGAEEDSATSALGCYIDLLPAGAQRSLAGFNLDAVTGALPNWCRRLCLDLRTRPLRHCRVDAIIRRALFAPAEDRPDEGLGITAYITTCGRSESEASAVLARALSLLTDSVFTVAGFGS
jgi:hypothetical protein